jgi:hypothetical protein
VAPDFYKSFFKVLTRRAYATTNYMVVKQKQHPMPLRMHVHIFF